MSLKVSDSIPSIFCQEEGWKIAICPRLLKAQHDDGEEHLPAG